MSRNSDIKVLVINCGSSSVKFQLINIFDEKVLAGGIVERLGLPQSLIKFKFGDKDFTRECGALDQLCNFRDYRWHHTQPVRRAQSQK